MSDIDRVYERPPAAALFAPLRPRVQHAVDRRFNRARHDADRTVAQFADHLKDAVDLDWVRADLARVVQQALEPVHTSVWTIDSPPAQGRRPVRVALHDHGRKLAR